MRQRPLIELASAAKMSGGRWPSLTWFCARERILTHAELDAIIAKIRANPSHVTHQAGWWWNGVSSGRIDLGPVGSAP